MNRDEMTTHQRMAAESFQKSAEHHRRAADARERGDEAEADRLTEEATRHHRTAMQHEEQLKGRKGTGASHGQ